MKRFLSKLDIYSTVGMIVAFILFICCLIVKEVSGVEIVWMSRVAMVLIIISIVFIVICYVVTVVELIRDFCTSRKNKR